MAIRPALQAYVEGLPDTAFKNKASRQLVLNTLADVTNALDRDDKALATRKLKNFLKHANGCGTSPSPNDWISDCSAQAQIQNLTQTIIADLGQ